jgi:hypothetical protein
MTIRLIAIDLDGTLLRADHTPHPYVTNLLLRAREDGIRIVIASGRSIQSIRKVLLGIWEVDAAVATNGADVWAGANHPIHRDKLNDAVKKRVVSYAVEHNLHLSCYSTDGTYALHESEYLREYRHLVQGLPVEIRTPDQILEMPIFKLVFILEASRLPGLRAEIEPELVSLGADMTESAPRYLEILPKNVNKCTGLMHLCQHLGIEQNEVAAIGDYRNDIEMLKWVGLSGAVANALPEIKSLADYTVSSNEEGGVGEFIAQFVLQR